jgi:hypothetical protein
VKGEKKKKAAVFTQEDHEQFLNADGFDRLANIYFLFHKLSGYLKTRFLSNN